MQLTRFGRTGVPVSRLCLGTATFGRQTDERVSLQILDKAADAGINFIDTADFYPMGAEPAQLGSSEEITGRWLKGRRDRFILATKAGAAHGPVALGPGLFAQAFARCNRRVAAPPWHRLGRPLPAPLR